MQMILWNRRLVKDLPAFYAREAAHPSDFGLETPCGSRALQRYSDLATNATISVMTVDAA